MSVTALPAGPAGSAALTITSYGITGSSNYTLVGTQPAIGSTIPAGGVTFQIQFLPLSNGNINGTFTLVTNGVDSGTQTIALNGIGAVPLVSYSSNKMFQGVNTELTDTSAVQYLYVNSIGGGPLTVNSVSFIGIDGSKAYFITHKPASSIAPGGVDSIGVRFTPDLEGQPQAQMVINTTATNIPSDTVTMDGVGILPHLAIDSAKSWPLPTTINFDSVKLGADSTIQVQLSNPGSDTIAIEKNFFESYDPDFTLAPITGTDTLIPPGGSENIGITFTPQQQGTRVATIRIRTDIPHTETTPPQDTSQFVINVVGIGVPTGKLLVTGPAQTDSALIGKSICQTDTLWNTGAASITVTSVTITGTNGADFDTSGLNLPLTLGANSSMKFQVCADPSQTGAETALLTASGTSSETPTKATLNLGVFGESVADTAIVAQPFAPESCGPDTMLVTVTNEGNIAETYQGSIPLNPNFTLLGSGTSPLTPAGGIDTFFVLFTPTSGTATGVLNFTTGGADISPITLTATGGAAVIAGTASAPMTSIGQTSAPFTVTVSNTGTCPWTSGATVTVDPQFTCTTGSTTIAAGGSAPFTFTYTPNTEAPNTYPVTFPLSTEASSVNVSITTSTDAVQPASVSNGFSLQQNYPNPFSGTSNVEITLPVGCLVHLAIINVEGQVVQTVLNQHYDAGSFEISFDATGLASGTYYYQMTAGDVTLTRQMAVVK